MALLLRSVKAGRRRQTVQCRTQQIRRAAPQHTSLFRTGRVARSYDGRHCRHLTTDAAFQEPREPSQDAESPAFNGQTKLLINGRFVDAVSKKTFQTIDPATEKVIANVAEAGAADVDLAVSAAKDALDIVWAQMPGRERGGFLYRLADLVEEHSDELAALEALDNGKSLSLAKAVDAPACAAMLRYWAGWADKINGRQIPMNGDFLCYTRHEPVGVVGAIIPWNLPLIALAAKVGPALTCGNTVVLKPAEQTPLTALRVGELAMEAGLPSGVLNIVPGMGAVAGAAITANPLVDKVSFTGSLEVGKQIQRAAADTLKRTTLELGGKNPSIVFADADIDQALEHVHNGLFWNKGEACAAGTRIFVQDEIFEEFVEKATAKALSQRVGHPFHPETQQGALVSQEQLDKVLGYIKSGVSEGAKLIGGGERIGTCGYYVSPAVFVDVDDDMRIFREEIFGPVMTLTRFSGLDEVVERANNTQYGLAAGVFTRDITKGHAVAAGLRAGMVFWNCYHAVDVAAPFGGFKQSGIGREGGPYGLEPYLEIKNVVLKVV